MQPSVDDSAAVRKFDIIICNEQGEVALRLTSFTLRTVQALSVVETMLVSTQWQAQPLSTDISQGENKNHWLLLCDTDDAQEIESYFPENHCLRLTSMAPLEQRYSEYAKQLLQFLQQRLQGESTVQCHVQVIAPCTGEQSVMQGLESLLRTAHLEYPTLSAQIIMMDDLSTLSNQQLIARLRTEAVEILPAVRYQAGQRLTPSWTVLENTEMKMPWREEGVYWITGGLGGLGRAVAIAIAQTVKPVLILSGRRKVTPEQEEFATRLRELGATVELLAVDVNNSEEMNEAVTSILARYGQLNGVIHSAGIIQDRLLVNMNESEMDDVLAPKVSGATKLDYATRDVDLDWIVFYSSIAGAWGNIGQSGYAVANSYLDHFASYRQSLVEQGLHYGKTVSLGWPIWASTGGMQTDDHRLRYLRQQAGIVPMPDTEGVAALMSALTHPQSYLVVLYGEKTRLLTWLKKNEESLHQCPEPSVGAATLTTVYAVDEMAAQIESVLMDLVASHLHLPVDVLDRDTPLAEFGFDSITLTSFGGLLNERYGLVLSPTVFFETPTLGALAEYLAREHGDTLAKIFISSNASDTATTLLNTSRSEVIGSVRRHRKPIKSNPSITQTSNVNNEPIAVIGMSGCFPQSPDITALWQNLAAGRDCIAELPPERWDNGIRPKISHAGIIDNIDGFDPLFFGISPSEAQLMDPQQRLLMLYVHKAIEDAGYSVQSLSGSNAALLVGTMTGGYAKILEQAGVAITGHTGTSLAGSMGPNRMSYWLDWRGPSEPIETACSSSLVAIHKAVALLRSGECDLAVAGGVNTLLSNDLLEMLTQSGMLSPEGRCQTFSAQANGYVRGEGVGMLLLKPLSAAERDGDNIYGVILSSAQNHGGRATSLTAPNPQAQAQLIEKAVRKAGITPESIGYIDTHGTGTALGDPVEVEALKQAFRNLAQEETLPIANCGLGTIKSNVGHLELAAGVAGVIKVLLMLRHRQLVPTINSEPRNPHIALEGQPFYVVDKGRPWEALTDTQGHRLPLRAGISSFGFGGVNAHIVLEEYQATPGAELSSSGSVVVVLSARSHEQLKISIANLHQYLCENTVNLSNLAWTLQVGRDAMPVRVALIVDNQRLLIEKLACLMSDETVLEHVWQGEVKRNQSLLSVFNTDDDLRFAVATWMEKGKLAKLAELWVQGLPVEWRKLYGDSTPRRLSLPTYPFALQRYWAPKTSSIKGSVTATLSANMPTIDGVQSQPVCFSEEWKHQPIEVVDTDIQWNRVLCLLSDTSQASQATHFFADRIPQVEVHCLCVEPEAWRDALRSIGANSGHIDLLLDLRSLAANENDVLPMIQILRALHDAQIRCHRLLWVGECTDDLEQAHLEARIGLVRSLKYNFPDMVAITVNGRAASPTSLSEWLTRLWREVNSTSLGDVLYIDGERYVNDLVSLPIQQQQKNPFHRGDTCWIIGGVGGLGAHLARYLAQQHGVTLALSGRSQINADIQQLIVELEAHGVRAIYVLADVIDASAMAQAYQQVNAHFGQLDGVIHAAGIEEQGDILTISDTQFHQILAAKITGIQVIDALLSEQPPRFICYFSSIAGVMGDFGSGAYAMANRFMLAYARLRGDVLAIGWPLWQEGGMGNVRIDEMTRYLNASGQRALETKEGMTLFTKLLSVNDGKQPLVMMGDATQMAKLLRRAQVKQSTDIVATKENQTLILGQGYRPEMEELTLRQKILWDLTEHTHQLLRLPREVLEVDANLAEYGVDSVRLIEITRLLNAHYGLSLTPSIFFSHLTLEQLAQYLECEHGERMAIFYQPVDEPDTSEIIHQTAKVIEPTSTITPALPMVNTDHDSIAIIGMSGRFPQADNPDALWDILAQGRCVVQPYPQERLPTDGQWNSTFRGWLGAMSNVDEFDPFFFEISPREAEIMDPRQRLLLQEAWRALEDAGYGDSQLKQHTIGMFVGVEEGDYSQLYGDMPDVGALTANHSAILASRISYALNLRGPAMAINTACSSGLVALHQACQSLRTQECDTVIAAGVSLMATPVAVGLMEKSGMSSPNGTCYAFDQRANGMVPGEACVALVLKRLSQAQVDGDPIYAVITASGINYDGKSQGITAPNGAAQVRLLQDIYQRYNVAPEKFDYIVAHGTGTPLGDSIEINALNNVFKPYSLDGFYTPVHEEAIAQGLSYNKWGGFVREEDIRIPFTGNTTLNPAQRLFIEAVQNALVSAGYNTDELALSNKPQIGVYVGEVGDITEVKTGEVQTTSAATSYLISDLFGFTGPSMSINTHSASSLTAMHMACLSLRQGECEVAIAGGISWLEEENWRLLCGFNLMGGRQDSRSFAAERDGMLFADGAGAVVLKPLSAALRDGDNVIALIRSTISGFIDPMGEHYNPVNRLAELIRENFRRAAIDPCTIGYVDVAAAGLPVGDALEMAAMNKAFNTDSTDHQSCALGSVQSNIGHAGAASGMSQLAKVILQLQHRQLTPGFYHDLVLDKALSLEQSPFWVPKELTRWKAFNEHKSTDEKAPLRAMINSQGYGGFYAGAIIESVVVPENSATMQDASSQLIILSDNDPASLRSALSRLLCFIDARHDLRLTDVAYTLQTEDQARSHRWAVMVDSLSKLSEVLRHFLDCANTDANDDVMIGDVVSQNFLFNELLDEEALQMILQRYIADRHFNKLASWWIKGGNIDWSELYTDRIKLPLERDDKEII